jgi:hypothetical protein
VPGQVDGCKFILDEWTRRNSGDGGAGLVQVKEDIYQ